MLQTEKLYALFQQASGVCTDTRKLNANELFFALKGPSFNGNLYAQQALENGAIAVVVDEAEVIPAGADSEDRFILVDDVLTALQQLAGHHRDQLNIPIVGITGSNGKTTTKELIQAVLSTTLNTLATAGNFNNHIGVPLTLLRINASHEIAVIEMGANHVGEIASYCEWAKPDYGLITNIGKAHLEGFGGYEGVIRAKSELYKYIHKHNGLLFVNDDDELLRKLSADANFVTYGTNASVSGQPEESAGRLTFSFAGKKITTNLTGQYNFYNAMAAVAIGRHFGVSDENIAAALSTYSPSNNRSQIAEIGNTRFILDAYNANPTSMQAAIHNLAGIDAGKKLAFLGDMLELGEYSDEEHGRILDLLDEKGLNETVLVGPEFGRINNDRFRHFTDVKEAKKWFDQQDFGEYTILIKGSRGIALEKLLEPQA